MTPQAERVRELLTEGLTRKQIAERLGVSAPRVTQIITSTPALIPYQRRPDQPSARLRSYRNDLIRLRHAALDVSRSIRRELKALDEELQAYELDKLLGLRS